MLPKVTENDGEGMQLDLSGILIQHQVPNLLSVQKKVAIEEGGQNYLTINNQANAYSTA